MDGEGLSQTRKRAWTALLIWSGAGLGFLVTFFLGGGAEGFATDSPRHLLGAAFLGLGFSGYWLSLWLTRQREGAGIASDERDLMIMARANQTTLVVVMVAVFTFAIGLWTVFEASGQVPVGWMWFFAYGSVILASVTSSLTTLILDGREGGHA
jgi:uncharacterized membrane protein